MIAATLAFALQASAAPHPSSAPPAPPVVVTAPRKSPTQKSSIDRVVMDSDEEQIARFEWPLCPGIIGLDARLATTMVAIIRSNAEAAGAPVDKADCRPNAIVVFVNDPRAFMVSLGKRSPMVIRSIPKRRRSWAVASDAPIRSWHAIAAVSADGVPFVSDPTTMPLNTIHLATRLSRPIRLDMAGAVAVIDAARLDGATVQQLADLATMHLLLDISPKAADVRDDTILHLMSTDDAPATLTALDRGMLSGLYRAPRNNVTGGQQRMRMDVAATKAATP